MGTRQPVITTAASLVRAARYGPASSCPSPPPPEPQSHPPEGPRCLARTILSTPNLKPTCCTTISPLLFICPFTTSALPLIDKMLNFSGPQFLHLYNGDNHTTYLTELLGELNELIHTEYLKQSQVRKKRSLNPSYHPSTCWIRCEGGSMCPAFKLLTAYQREAYWKQILVFKM